MLGIRPWHRECRGKGTGQESAEVQTCPPACMGPGLGRQLTVLLWGEAPRAPDNGRICVAHLGFKIYLSVFK